MLFPQQATQPLTSTIQLQQAPLITTAVSLPQSNVQPQQSIQQNTNPQIALTTSKPVSSTENEFAKLVKYYQERPPLTKAEQLELLMSQTNYQRNKIQKNFLKQINVRKTQYLLIDTLSTKVNVLFQKFGLNERNIEYQSEELLRLKQIVQTNQQKENNLFKSILVIKEFYSIQLKQYLDFNYQFQANRNVFNAYNLVENYTIQRQQKGIKNLLQENKQQFDCDKTIGIKPLIFNTHNQLIIEKLFFEPKQLTDNLKSFLQYQKISKTNVQVDQKKFYSELFECFVKIQSDHKDIMKLLSLQFKDINFISPTIEMDLIKNSVNILEEEQKKKIGVLDIANLNQKFKDIYLENLSQDLEIKKEGQFYPSGILFLLMRCGELKSAKSLLFQFLRQQKYNKFFELLGDQSLTNYEKIQQLELLNEDDLFLQCCYLAFDSGEVLEIFETTHFELDQDLFLWMTLKTTHINQDQINGGNNNWLLRDLQEAIPKNINPKMDILLLRYDQILLQLQKNNESFLSKMEYIILYCVLNNIFKGQFKNEDISDILNSTLELLFEKYPELGVLLIMIYEQEFEEAIQKIEQQMKKQIYTPQVFQNQRFIDIFESALGDTQKNSQIIKNYLIFYFEKSLIQIHSEFMENGIKSNNLNTIMNHHKTFISSIDQFIQNLKNYIPCVKIGAMDMASQLYYMIGIVLAIGECQFQMKTMELKQNQDQSIKGFTKNTNNPKQYYNFFTTIYSYTNADPKQKQLFNLLQTFNYLIQSTKIDQFNIDKFRQLCSFIDISKLSLTLIQNKQSYLLKLFFWLIQQQLEFNIIQFPELKQMKDSYTKTCQRQRDSTSNTFNLVKEELNLHFQDIKSLPQ